MSIYDDNPDTGLPRHLERPDLQDLHFGEPRGDDRCAYADVHVCPNRISFYITIPNGSNWRKAWASCAQHLSGVIVQMRRSYGGWEGVYHLVMEPHQPGSGELITYPADREPEYRGGWHEHDGFVRHTHEVRADHLGVAMADPGTLPRSL